MRLPVVVLAAIVIAVVVWLLMSVLNVALNPQPGAWSTVMSSLVTS